MRCAMPTSRAIALGLVPAVLFAAAIDVRAAEKARKRRHCINKGEINVMRSLDDKHVFVRASSERSFLLTLDPCPGLRDARSLQIVEASTRICADGTSLLSFSLPATGSMRCRVDKIEPVRDLADAEERAAPEPPREKNF